MALYWTNYFLALVLLTLKGELRCKMNLWSNNTLVSSQPFSEICFHKNRM